MAFLAEKYRKRDYHLITHFNKIFCKTQEEEGKRKSSGVCNDTHVRKMNPR